MTEQATKNQHQAPRVYLKQFADQDRRVFVFNKETGRVAHPNIKSAASEDYFYDFPEDVALHPHRPQKVEKELSAREREYADLNIQILSSLDDLYETSSWNLRPAIKPEQREALAEWVSLQALRTQEYRSLQHQSIQTHIDGVKRILEGYRQGMASKLALNDPKGIKFSIIQDGAEYDEEDYTTYDPNLAGVYQAQSMFGESGSALSNILMEHIWLFGVNLSDHTLYTSDNPVVKYPHIHKHFPTSGGFRSEGIEVVFPLSPKYLLIMRERNYHQEMEEFEERFMRLSEENVNFYNRLQVTQSYKQVCCLEDDFDWAREVCEKNPEIRSPDKPRVRSVRVGDKMNDR